ncbi:UspA, universal stress protein [Methylocaldum marinum]|uniref:UspA, universal stress protein n=1 Tax=Methylocaldum marinum TaxID=1432792 RepID=A0A250KYE4_9GAMM|nr:universal stress protein [Methylocaldum marinum]BBA36703.1 UspA, universal stress protein [Methylocaldum marinum]
MTKVMACIDGSRAATAVCDYAAWASRRLRAPLTFIHVLDKSQYPVDGNLSGNIGLGSRESLLEELTALDEKRGKLAREQGRLMLAEAKARAVADGIESPSCVQRHGSLVDTLLEFEEDIRLLVMGKQGETTNGANHHIGSHLETIIRTMHRPILVTPHQFREPKRVMFAFDGSATTRKGIEMVANSPLFRGLSCHILTAGKESSGTREHLNWARAALARAGFDVTAEIRDGDVLKVTEQYRQEHDIDLLIMGAYGHSRIREFLVGSTTTSMLTNATPPVLVLR